MGKPAERNLPPPGWADRFFDALKVTGSVASAAKHVGVSRQLVYQWKAKSKEFADGFEDSWETLRDELEGSAMRRAINGWLEDVWMKDEKGVPTKVGQRRVYSAGLTIWMLKSHRPERYRETRGDGDSLTAQEHASMIRGLLVETGTVIPMVAALPSGPPAAAPPAAAPGV